MIPLTRMLQSAGKDTTEEAWRRLQESNVALRRYRAIATDEATLAAHFEELPADSSARAWRGILERTKQALKSRGGAP